MMDQKQESNIAQLKAQEVETELTLSGKMLLMISVDWDEQIYTRAEDSQPTLTVF